MRSYWLWSFVFLCTWFITLFFSYGTLFVQPMILLMSALFFGLFFLSPLCQRYYVIHTVLFFLMGLLCFRILHPSQVESVSFFSFLIYVLIAGKGFYRLPLRYAMITYLYLITLAIIPYFQNVEILINIIFTGCLIGVAFLAFSQTIRKEKIISELYETLQSEFRTVKRRLATTDKLARKEEREQIARDMHDSVGHQLTALLMQLEVLRMQSTDEKTKKQFTYIKELAKTSLDETRSAVKTLKNEEEGGLSAIIRLIRKLEAESHVRITFSVKNGAFTAPLSNEQTVAVYRVVQESLTNMMRHSQIKEATIIFELVANNYFQVEINNPFEHQSCVKEGFGITSMRERMEHVGGKLDVQKFRGQFIVRGKIPLERELFDK
ncbi:Sensor histidine kinase LiaS [Paraliobacillus sp. PM-2]|uniref:sensor histidine kinase n=1 Tax=Paraliobacillus sp. PM-2 TaxID=1462524 RepID=UPI00061CAB3F|nr:sensor histidine kinase [Paraliobacillus sp. PM-2]CQR48418.1 Sensor histidine kinase LiaS [Paraliobacillus sp. PM-2]